LLHVPGLRNSRLQPEPVIRECGFVELQRETSVFSVSLGYQIMIFFPSLFLLLFSSILTLLSGAPMVSFFVFLRFAHHIFVGSDGGREPFPFPRPPFGNLPSMPSRRFLGAFLYARSSALVGQTFPVQIFTLNFFSRLF